MNLGETELFSFQSQSIIGGKSRQGPEPAIHVHGQEQREKEHIHAYCSYLFALSSQIQDPKPGNGAIHFYFFIKKNV